MTDDRAMTGASRRGLVGMSWIRKAGNSFQNPGGTITFLILAEPTLSPAEGGESPSLRYSLTGHRSSIQGHRSTFTGSLSHRRHQDSIKEILLYLFAGFHY